MPRRIQLITAEPDDWVESLRGKYVDDRHWDTLIRSEAVDVLKPDGSPLLLFRPGVLPLDVCERARPALRMVGSRWSEHRGFHTGVMGYFDRPTPRGTPFTRDYPDQWSSVLPFIRAADHVYRKHLPSIYKVQRGIALPTPPDWVIADTAFTTVTVNTWDRNHKARTPVHRDAGNVRQGCGMLSVFIVGSVLRRAPHIPQVQGRGRHADPRRAAG